MTQKIDLDRVREINPVPEPPDDPEAAERLLRRVLAQPRRPPRRRRRAIFRVAAVAATAVVAAAGVALWPSSGESPDVIASAAAALSQPDTILHFKTQGRDGPGSTTEEWHSSDGRHSRVVAHHPEGGSMEMVRDFDAELQEIYVKDRDEIIRHPQKDWFRGGPRRPDSLPYAGIDSFEGLAALLQRARDGDDAVRIVGEPTIRDIPTYELRIESTIEVRDTPRSRPRSQRISRLIYVDKERFLPVRIADSGFGSERVTDYLEMERLPRTPENERLLRMPPHPGAKVIVEDRL
jgi:hypothetical protein